MNMTSNSVNVRKTRQSTVCNSKLRFSTRTVVHCPSSISFTQTFRRIFMFLPLPLLPIECCFCLNSDTFIGEWASHWTKNYTLGKWKNFQCPVCWVWQCGPIYYNLLNLFDSSVTPNLGIVFSGNLYMQIKLEVNPMKYNCQQIPRLTVTAAVTALGPGKYSTPKSMYWCCLFSRQD